MSRPLKKRCPRCGFRKILMQFRVALGHDCCDACGRKACARGRRGLRAECGCTVCADAWARAFAQGRAK